MNQLSESHLKFFYQDVLQIQSQDARPDKVHLIFEIANHLNEGYLVEEGTVFRDGKDDNGIDIDFTLDEEVIIDKAQIASLKTLYVNRINIPRLDEKDEGGVVEAVALGVQKDNSEDECCLGGKVLDTCEVIEGVYIAPLANAADGVMEEFEEGQSTNWSTLGAKKSKFLPVGNESPDYKDHPTGRIGFAVASPVLFLNEGKREIKITLTCKFKENIDHCLDYARLFEKKNTVSDGCFVSKNIVEDHLNNSILTPLQKSRLKTLIEKGFEDWEYRFIDKNDVSHEVLKEDLVKGSAFKVYLSGEEEWVVPDCILSSAKSISQNEVELEIFIALDSSYDPITVFDKNKNGELIDLNELYPVCKLEFDSKKIYYSEINHDHRNHFLYLFNFITQLRLENITIDVNVCGLKNLVVQNEENLQDVNELVLPFGTRPKIGAEFYIGSKEVFCKKWDSFHLVIDWKDRPESFETYYEEYSENLGEESGNSIVKVKDESFLVKTALLQDGLWRENSEKELFVEKLYSSCENSNGSEGTSINSYQFDRLDFGSLQYDIKPITASPLGALNVNSRDSFLRFQLYGSDFLHEEYPYVLARKLMILAGLIDPNQLEDLKINVDLINTISAELDAIFPQPIPHLINQLNEYINRLVNIRDDVLSEIGNTEDLRDALDNILTSLTSLNSSLLSIETILSASGTIDIVAALTELTTVSIPALGSIISEFGTASDANTILFNIKGLIDRLNLLPGANPNPDIKTLLGVQTKLEELKGNLATLNDAIELAKEKFGNILIVVQKIVGIVPGPDEEIPSLSVPNEPYTPLIKSISIDYSASADLDSIVFIHLLPFQNSSKRYPVSTNSAGHPELITDLTDEGTLFLGINDIRKGSTLQLLFQLAEATADSESDKANIEWAYLTNNEWVDLRAGFEILSDDTNGLTRSGIIKFALPRDISNEGNTRMPPVGEEGSEQHLYWIKASAKKNTAGVAETIGIHTQAARATFQIVSGADENRVVPGIEPEQISKPLEPDFNIKKVQQPYVSFGGKRPEHDELLFKRVSEHLRHKGRSINPFDIEHLVLEAFPEIFKCKCISHTMGLSANDFRRDLEVAPGFLVIAVIPDLTKLVAGDGLEPRAPVSMLNDIKQFLRLRVSPFARIRVMNPRYERIKVSVTVRFAAGVDEEYHKQKLKEDLNHFLAPWYLGDSDKLSFGQVVTYSEVIGFIEHLDYIDFVDDLKLYDQKNSGDGGQDTRRIVPATARSILTGGEIIVSKNDFECDPPEDQRNEPQDLPAPKRKYIFHGEEIIGVK